MTVSREVIQKLAEDWRVDEAAAATLYHADLHKRNIFVSEDDPCVVTDIIDWQSSSIEPAFEYADRVPDFSMPLLNSSPEATPTEIQPCLRKHTFDLCLQALIPKLHLARVLDEDLLRPFRYCHRTWKDGAVAFREELIRISRRWEELGLAGRPPYTLPNSTDLAQHHKEFQKLVEAVRLKDRLIDLLGTNSDGWVPAALWNTTKAAHQDAFRELMQAVRDADRIDAQSMNEEDLRRAWPFDLE